MFDHVTIRVSDLAASRTFYVEALGLPTHDGELVEWGGFSIVADGPVTRRLHVGFGVEDRGAVDAWWNRMTEAGYESDGEPGPRPRYGGDYYGAFVLDPDGNSIEAVHHGTSRRGIDHLWLRTRDVAAARAFYETIAPAVGILLKADEADLVRFTDGDGSFSYVAGDEPTEHVDLAFGVAEISAVEAFRRAAIRAGYRDDAAPRPHRPGCRGASVLDPDGHTVSSIAWARGSRVHRPLRKR